MISKQTLQVIKKLPKVDLHLHLDGSVKTTTVIELAKIQGIQLPTYEPDELQPYLQINNDCKSLKEYLSKFYFVSLVLHTEEALERVAFEIVEQAYRQNCKYIEVRFGPQLHLRNGLSLEQTIHAVIKGLKKGEHVFGVKANAIACCLRHHSVNENIQVVEAAAQFLGEGIAGVDLAGDEATYPAFLFRKVFALAKKKEIPITIHAGEAAGPENVKEAIKRLGAVRIGHGVRLKEDLKLLQEIHSKQIPLEMCPISNIQTKAAKSWDDYPLKEYFDKGLNITVNTDNLTVSKTNLSKEYAILVKEFNFSLTDLSTLVMNGVEASFIDVREKEQLKKVCLEGFEELNIKHKHVI